jgi:uncharacterized protein with HEPN domain
MKEIYPDIPWKEMTGMLDKLGHDYIRVNVEEQTFQVKQFITIVEKYNLEEDD